MKNSTKRYLLLLPSIILGTLAVVTIVSAATTIGTDIDTGGSLTVSGNVGIGPTTPQEKLTVDGTGLVTGQLAVGNVASTTASFTDGVYNQNANSNIVSQGLNVNTDLTGDLGGQVVFGSDFNNNYTNTGSNPVLVFGQIHQTTVTQSSTGPLNGLVGLLMGTENKGSGDVDSIVGAGMSVDNNGSGVVSDITGLSVEAHQNVAGTIDVLTGINSYVSNTDVGNINIIDGIISGGDVPGNGNVGDFTLLHANSITHDGAGTITNLYGIKVDDMSQTANVTNNFNIYSAGANSKNYFGGNVGIGTTTPQTKLQISAGASATTTVTIGELGLTSSKACVNMNQADGSAASFYIAGGVMVIENNYCR